MANGNARSVQDYLDETPIWADGTPIHSVELTVMQWRIWWLAAAGKFFEGMIVFMTGVALPLVALEFHLDAAGKGMVGAATLFGILVGATSLGGLADHVGRKRMFIVEMAIFTIFLTLAAACTTFPLLLVCLFGIGVALGCDYPASVSLAQPATGSHGPAGSGWRALFSRRHRRATLLASIPWFLQDLGTYGIGIFTPTILATTIGKVDSHGHNLLKDIGVGALLCILVTTSLVGVWITAHYAIETNGVNLETLETPCSGTT